MEEVEEVGEGRIKLPSSKSHRCFLKVWRNCLVGKQAKGPQRPKWPLLVQTPGFLQEGSLHIPTKEKEAREKNPALLSARRPACESDSPVMHSGRDSAH